VGVDRKTGKIIAFGTVVIANSVLKGRIGKIENIVTHKEVRGKGLGKIVIEILQDEAWRNQCNIIGLFC
jgi:N-acetylglutamate synthase-like GNAT family acetyltransferase